MTSVMPATYERLLVKAPFLFRREVAPLPEASACDYLVRVDVCGLCRSDLHAAASWAGEWQEVGHEFGGTVVAARRPDGRFGVGDRVAVRNASPCGECPRCLEGLPRGCQRLVVNMQGFRDYAQCDERSLVSAAGLDDDALALVEPTNVVLDLLHAAQLETGHRLTVLGSGTLGLLTAYLARAVWGVSRVVLVGRQPTSPLAEALGLPDYVSAAAGPSAGPSAGPDISSEASSQASAAAAARASGLARARSADRVLVTTPPSTLEQALALCRPGGWVLTVGLDDTERCRISLDVGRLIFGQHTLKGVCAAPNAHFEQAVSLLREHGDRLRPLIAHRTPRGRLESALESWHERSPYDGKTIVVADGRIQ